MIIRLVWFITFWANLFSPDFESSQNCTFSDTLLDIFHDLTFTFTNFEAKCGLKNSKKENCLYKGVQDLKLPAMFSIKVYTTAL